MQLLIKKESNKVKGEETLDFIKCSTLRIGGDALIASLPSRLQVILTRASPPTFCLLTLRSNYTITLRFHYKGKNSSRS